MMNSEISKSFRNSALGLFEGLIPGFIREGKYQLNLAFGCTGGRHRSVSMAIVFHELLAAKGYKVSLTHRDV